MECLDCKISQIPEGHSGMVFLLCEDMPGKFYKGKFYLCSKCWMQRREDLRKMEEERRQKLLQEDQAASKKKKKKGRLGVRRGPNDYGSSH